MADEQSKPVSSDPTVPTGPQPQPAPQTGSADVSAATAEDGTVDAQKAAKAGAVKRQNAEASKRGGTNTAGVIPTGGVVRQIEDGTETDRRTGANADKSLAGENLPVLRSNEPDPRQGVTTGDLTNPGIPDGDKAVKVKFLKGYHLYNAGETATFSQEEVDRLKLLPGVIE